MIRCWKLKLYTSAQYSLLLLNCKITANICLSVAKLEHSSPASCSQTSYWSSSPTNNVLSATHHSCSRKRKAWWNSHNIGLMISGSRVAIHNVVLAVREETREIMMGEGNKQPPLCWLPLWVVELGFVAKSLPTQLINSLEQANHSFS